MWYVIILGWDVDGAVYSERKRSVRRHRFGSVSDVTPFTVLVSLRTLLLIDLFVREGMRIETGIFDRRCTESEDGTAVVADTAISVTDLWCSNPDLIDLDVLFLA